MNRVLLTLVAVFAFVAWFLYPPAPAEDEKGRVLANILWIGAGPAESRSEPFAVLENYTRISFNYNITQAVHVRANLTAPDGAVHEARAIDRPGDLADELDLEVARPMRGAWRLTVYTLPDPGAGIEWGNFTVLGFGGAVRPG